VNGNWGNSGNWSTAVNTTGTFSLVFGGTTRVNTTNNLGAVSIDSLAFTNNGSAGRTSAFTLSGSSLQLLNASVTTTAFTSGAVTDVISAPVTIVGTASFVIGSAHNVRLSNTVSGGTISKSGIGSLFLTGSFASDLSIAQGSVGVNAVSAVSLDERIVKLTGTGAVGGNLTYSDFTGSTSAQFQLDGNGGVSVVDGSLVRFTNPTFNVPSASSAATLTFSGGGVTPSSVVVDGVIGDNLAGAVSVSIIEGNLYEFNGINTYTGVTSIASSAKALVDGQIFGSVTSAGHLGGSGTIIGPVAMTNGGILSPGGTSAGSGSVTDTIGTLTLGNSLTLGSSVTSRFTVGGTSAGLDYDQILGSSSVDYGGTLALTLTGTQAYAKDTVFNLFKDFSSRTGDFSSITLAAAGTPYNGLSFTNLGGGIWETGSTAAPLGEYLRFEQATGDLVVVPEPSTFVLAGLGVVLAGAQVWRRRRVAA
jgi:hypothetical protein